MTHYTSNELTAFPPFLPHVSARIVEDDLLNSLSLAIFPCTKGKPQKRDEVKGSEHWRGLSAK